jgi:hypothetical protein
MADLSDDLRDVGGMIALYRAGYDVVVGSRYMRGGRIVGGPWLKKALSRLAGTSLHYLRGVATHDATNAFKMYDVAMLNSLQIESKEGFELNLEITVKAFCKAGALRKYPPSGLTARPECRAFVYGSGCRRTCAGTCMLSVPNMGSEVY